MRTYLEQACESVDAAIFSSDVLYSDEERAELKEYVERWARAIAEHEAGTAEIAKSAWEAAALSERERVAAWIEPQRNDIPATGAEFAAAIRAL